MRNKIEVGLQETKTGHINARISEIRTPEIPAPRPTIPQHSPHQWTALKYGTTAPQLAHPEDDSLELNTEEANTVQQVVGTLF